MARVLFLLIYQFYLIIRNPNNCCFCFAAFAEKKDDDDDKNKNKNNDGDSDDKATTTTSERNVPYNSSRFLFISSMATSVEEGNRCE
jgi:ABC-type phosphate transport system substrate-binding protein